MKSFWILIIGFSVSVASAEEQLVSINYSHTLRIPNSRVTITIDDAGLLVLKTESRGNKHRTTKRQLDRNELSKIKNALASIDWPKIGKDKNRGVDGTTIRISYDGTTVSLWSPDYNSFSRGLVKLEKMIEKSFKLAGLDKRGMPFGK